jgi:protein-S-isoprenylcysteine O-methyltransferase Ste14
MGLDIRWPIGLMFSLVGAMLLVCGVITGSDVEMYKRSLGININIYWGLLLLVFGGSMLFMAMRAAKAAQDEQPAQPAQPASKNGKRS